MNKQERLQVYASELAKLKSEGSPEGFIIFEDINYGKFVQFANTENRFEVILDIPYEMISNQDQLNKLQLITSGQLFDSGVSYQVSLLINQALLLIEQIFVDIYELPFDHDVAVEISLTG